MASVCAVGTSLLIQRHHHHRLPTRPNIVPSIRIITHSPSNFRFKSSITWQIKERLLRAFASKSDPSSGDSIKDKSDGVTSYATKGPPFLTILAGFFVFFVICWILGSIIMWLFSMIVRAPPTK